MRGVVIRSDVIVASSEGVLRCALLGDMGTVIDNAKYACYGKDDCIQLVCKPFKQVAQVEVADHP